MNEGWASYWHEKLFLQDDRINGHEVDFARVNAGVTSLSRVGLNPYALGMRLFSHIEELSEKGKLSLDFQRIADSSEREHYNKNTGNGMNAIFKVRENMADFMFVNSFVDQDFVDRHKLFVTGKRLNKSRKVWEYYVKSRKVDDYREMLFNTLYHPPAITTDMEKSKEISLYLLHKFENKPLVKEFISNTLLGLEYLWGGPVHLETSEVRTIEKNSENDTGTGESVVMWRRVLYTMKDRKLSVITI